MSEDKEKNEQLKDIPKHKEDSEKEKKLRAAPDEVIARALHDMIMKDHE